MRILHVIGWIDFADGGPPVIATRLAAAQAQLGHDVVIACYSSGAADQRTEAQLAQVAGWEKVRLIRLPRCSRMERTFGRGGARQLEPEIVAADVLHLHNVWEGILLRCAARARELHKPYLILLNGMLEPWSMRQRAWKKRLAMMLSHRKMLNSAILHVGTDEEGQNARQLEITAKLAVIPNGVSLEEIDSAAKTGDFRAARPQLSGRRFILFLSRLNHQKGLDYLAEAYAQIAFSLPDVDLVVAGPDGGQKELFQRRIAESGLTARTHVVGPLYGRDKYAAMRDCACFVLPSRHEGFSVAILEAMACSAPVVVTEACHFPQIAQAGAGEVVQVNAASVAAGLKRVLSDPDPARFGRAGRKLIETHYTWDTAARQTIAAYQQALGASNPP